jgi:hypothetical protein
MKLGCHVRRLCRPFSSDCLNPTQAFVAQTAACRFRPSKHYIDHEPKIGEKSISTAD